MGVRALPKIVAQLLERGEAADKPGRSGALGHDRAAASRRRHVGNYRR